MYTKGDLDRGGLGFAWIPIIIAAASAGGTIAAAKISASASQAQREKELEVQKEIFEQQLQAAERKQIVEQQSFQQTTGLLAPALAGLALVMLLK